MHKNYTRLFIVKYKDSWAKFLCMSPFTILWLWTSSNQTWTLVHSNFQVGHKEEVVVHLSHLNWIWVNTNKSQSFTIPVHKNYACSFMVKYEDTRAKFLVHTCHEWSKSRQAYPSQSQCTPMTSPHKLMYRQNSSHSSHHSQF